jgi:hypothetical protein
MSDAPETIWAMAGMAGKWSDAHATNNKPVTNTLTAPFVFKYTRTDHSQALIAAAYEAAVSAAYTGDDWHDRDIEPSIRELTPADAQAALDKLIADAERRGMERAAKIAGGQWRFWGSITELNRHGPNNDAITRAIDAIRAEMGDKRGTNKEGYGNEK